ncbi:alginate O-acetyltransferase [Geomonas limicola]|uniref:Alginate O-acetyltransferase n=1 Tax=Geomonas limicola TaxID=2740186 RepID=A0A6V8N4L5_9BACT|nr:MBOAT family protein [Geomonas limicola]GFO67381.1 alginate O-acetyltransferase [Geomonas limicola]
MLFNSYQFLLLFLPVTLVVYFFLNHKRLTAASNAWLLFASLVFYSWWNPAYLSIILVSILFNYTIGYLLAEHDSLKKHPVSKKSIFLCGLAGNLAFLCYFKYMDFFLGSLNGFFGTDLPLMHVVLPLGISFFTITQIAFLVDCYEGLVEDRKLLSYSLFVTFFPHLLAGPILHHKEMMPQFEATRNKVVNYRNLSHGLFLFLVGLFKKVIIADSLVKTVSAGFDASSSLTMVEAWVVSLSYMLQLYFDFSGYSDMALGVGLMFNIVLPVNFNSPYKACNIIDFWQRWHMSLTSFITTYLYAPILRSSRKITFGKSMLATFVAMFIAGIWHGAGWTFVIWGACHGAALVVNHLFKRKKVKLPNLLGWFFTFCFLNVTFVLFRAKNLGDAWKVLKGMAGLNGAVPAALTSFSFSDLGRGAFWKALLSGVNGNDATLYMPLLFLVLVLGARNSVQLERELKPTGTALAFLTAVGFYALINQNKVSEFLYFQF